MMDKVQKLSSPESISEVGILLGSDPVCSVNKEIQLKPHGNFCEFRFTVSKQHAI
jgi:hypothetical protein